MPFHIISRAVAKVRRLVAEARWGLALCGRRVFTIEAFRRLQIVESISSRFLHRHIRPDQAIATVEGVSADDVARFKVSVVIPVYNGISQGLERLLQSIREQTHRNLEIVAVDSGSTDGSVDLLTRYGAKVIRIPKSEFRHDYARNLGAENATGDFVLFTVCDCRFHDPQWVDIGVRHLLCYDAKSFSTPQSVDERAEPYARYLAWNFVQANNYAEGVNLLGNKRWGYWAYRLGGARARLRAVHVDDTNHLVRRDFFLKNPYFLSTCEDMGFGVKLIRANELFVYSTLTSVRHYHEYSDYQKYFSRVFVDLCVVERFLRPKSEMPCCDGMVDSIIAAGASVLDVLLRTLRELHDNGVRVVNFCGSANDAAEINSRALFTLFHESMMDPAFQVFQGIEHRSEGAELLTGRIGLMVDPRRRFSALQAFRNRAHGHVTRTCEVFERYLSYTAVSLDDFRHFVVLTFLNILARDLSLSMTFGRDERSRNVSVLQSIVWR